jgi:hypothetical protein
MLLENKYFRTGCTSFCHGRTVLTAAVTFIATRLYPRLGFVFLHTLRDNNHFSIMPVNLFATFIFLLQLLNDRI